MGIMHDNAQLSFILSLGSLALCTSACVLDDSSSGTDLGSFDVVGSQTKDTCGSDLADPRDFSVDLSNDDGTLQIAESDGSNAVSGPLEGDTATLTSTVTSNVGGGASSTSPCNLTQTITFDVTLDSATAPTGFSGHVSYAYEVDTSISTNTDCSGQLKSAGGACRTLPCSIEYSLTATKQ